MFWNDSWCVNRLIVSFIEKGMWIHSNQTNRWFRWIIDELKEKNQWELCVDDVICYSNEDQSRSKIWELSFDFQW